MVITRLEAILLVSSVRTVTSAIMAKHWRLVLYGITLTRRLQATVCPVLTASTAPQESKLLVQQELTAQLKTSPATLARQATAVQLA